MKKLLITIICLTALIMPSQSVMAENLAIQTDIDVIVKSAEEDPDNSVELGSGHPIILQDGTEVTFKTSNEADKDIRAAVILITEGEQGYEYVLENTSPYGTGSYAMYILFYRDGKEVKPQGSVTVSMKQPEGCENADVYSLTGENSRLDRLEVQALDKECSYILTESSYVVWVLPKTLQDEEVFQTTSGSTEAVKTGDETDVMLWIMLGIAAVVISIGIEWKVRRLVKEE